MMFGRCEGRGGECCRLKSHLVLTQVRPDGTVSLRVSDDGGVKPTEVFWSLKNFEP